MVVQDMFLTATAELADVVLPAAAAWAESEGTVTNSERRVQRVRKALEPPGEARDDLAIIYELARRMGPDWGWSRRRGRLERGAVAVAGPRRDVVRRGSRRSGGHPVAVLRRGPSRRAVPPQPALGGPGPGQPRRRSCRSSTTRRSTGSTTTIPIRLTTGRRLDSYNTGVQTGGYTLAAAARRDRSTSRRRTRRAYGLSEGERRPGRLAARPGGGAGPDRPGRCGRA